MMHVTTNPLSICADDLKLEIKQALQQASRLGFRAVDVGASSGPVSPRELSKSAQRHLTRYLSDLGLRLGSLRGPVGGPAYTDSANGERRLEIMRSIIAMAGDLRVPVVSTSFGATGSAQPAESESRLREILQTLANDSDRYGVHVAIETTGASPNVMGHLLRELNCPTIGACCDSGAMLMEGNDPHRIADDLAGRVHMVRARDATFGTSSASGRETAMGEGALDIPLFLASLHEAGFSGDIVVSRSESSRPAQDLLAAGECIRRHLNPS